jgi:hypothetical protein
MSTSGGSSVALDFGSAIVDFFAGLVAFLSGVAAGIASIFSALPWLIFAIVLTLAMIPWVTYHDEIIEEVEHAFRGVLYPAWRDIGTPIANFVRAIWNPLICWFNAANWWAYGVIREVIYPTLVECSNLKQVFVTLSDFLLAVLKDFVVDYFFQTGFYTGPADFTNICDKWILFWKEWMTLYSCFCYDLSLLMKDLPIIPSVFFSAQWADPQTWCAISNLVNAAMETFGILLKLVQQILQALLALIAPQSPLAALTFTRPNFYNVATLTCSSAKCLSRSTENALQRFWNDFIPFYFNFTDFLSPLDVGFCFIAKTINWVLTVVINIDRVVLYPRNGFWESDIKPLTIENLNILAPPTIFDPVPVPPLPSPLHYTITNYYLNNSYPFTPLNQVNPVYQQKRMTEAVCVTITRLICDATGGVIPCFSAQSGSIFQGFDFCCGTDALGTLIVDVTSSLVELSYHLVALSGQDFFLFLDQQPFLAIFVTDLVNLAKCLLSFLRLIPIVGRAVENLLIEGITWVLSMIRFIIQVVLGLATLPYFIFEMSGTSNFITTTNKALDSFIVIQDRMVAMIPESFVNSLCIILNSGFGIPPIPCGSCVIGGFIPLPPLAKRTLRTFVDKETGKVNSPWSLAAEVFGWKNPDTAYLVTPLLFYDSKDPEDTKTLITRMSPRDAWKRIRENKEGIADFNSPAEVDRFVDMKKAELLKRWANVATCADLKKEEEELKVNRPHIYRYNKQNGKYDCDPAEDRKEIKRIVQTPPSLEERLVLGPTIPPLSTCSNPTPDCFDLCCLFRTIVQTVIQLLSFAARFFNGFVQYQASRQGTQNDFPYFTGEFCEPQHNKPCFESDLVDTLLLAFQIPSCLCRFLNLVIPISADYPRSDLCCGIQRVSELVVCLLMVIINATNSIVRGNFDYFRMGLFFNDVSTLFDVALELAICLCNLIRAVFPITYIPELKNSLTFDVCCIPLALFNAAVEAVRVIVLTIISLATITISPDAYCFFRLDNDGTHVCSGTLDGIGLVVRVDKFINDLFPISDINVNPQTLSCSLTCAQSGAPGAADQGIGGLIPCICQLFNTLIPWRQNPGQKVSCDATAPNCQNINLCCPLVKLGIASNSLSKFVLRALVAIWQPWNGLPEFFVNFVFCDETANLTPQQCGVGPGGNPCAYTFNGIPQPSCGCGTFTCGKTNIIIDQLTALVSACLCEFVRLLDALIKMFFESLGSSWANCFCGSSNACGNNGILQSASKLVNVVLRTVINSIRKSPLPCFWNPAGYTQLYLGTSPVTAGSCTPGVHALCTCRWIKAPISHVEDSWIYSVLGPLANAMCQSIGDFMCIINSLFFIDSKCLKTGSLFLGSTIRWVFQFIFVLASLIEGLIRQFTEPQSSCVGTDHSCFQSSGSNIAFQGIQSKPLAKLLVAFLSFPVDMLIGDRTVACSGICPRGIGQSFDTLCDCYKRSPQTAATYQCSAKGKQCSVWDYGSYQTNFKIDPKCNPARAGFTIDGTFMGCTVTHMPQLGAVAGVLGVQGVNCVAGVGAMFPYCDNIEDNLLRTYNRYAADYCRNLILYDPTSPIICRPGTCSGGISMEECFRRIQINPNEEKTSCSVYNLCRPDQLPSCSSENLTPVEQACTYAGPIDGLIMGLFRYMNCGIPGNVLYPLIWFLSMVWQLAGAFIYFIVTLIFFIISLFSNPSGCACHDYTDPRQDNGVIKHTRTAALCYPCYDANGMCGPATTDPLNYVLFCEPHCPFMFGTNASDGAVVAAAQTSCVNKLTSYAHPDNMISTADKLCDGSYTQEFIDIVCAPGGFYLSFFYNTVSECAQGIYMNFITGLRTQTSCLAPWCQVGGPGIVPSFLGRRRGDKTGSAYPGNPKPDCFIKLLFDGLGAVIKSFVAIFTTPFISPAAYKRDVAPNVNFTESRADFWKRTQLLHFQQKTETKKDKREEEDEKKKHEPFYNLQKSVGEAVKRGLDTTSIDTMLKASPDVLPSHLRNILVQRKAGASPEEIARLIQEADGYEPLTHSGFIPSQPSTPELLLMALYEYDTSDCFTDPVSCVCRNFYIPEYCMWTPETGVIPTPGRKRRVAGVEWDARNKTRYAREDIMYPEEVLGVMLEKFVDYTDCDHNIKMCAMMPYNTIDSTTMEKWVSCVNKRIQGERLHDVSSGVITSNVMYYTQAPLEIFRNVVSTVKRNAEMRRDQLHEIRKAERQQRMEDFEPDFWKTLEERTVLGRQVLTEKMGVHKTSPIIEGIIQMDSIWYKYQTGYYHTIIERAWNSASGFQWPTPEEAFLDLHEATTELVAVFKKMNFREAITESVKQSRIVYGWVRDVLLDQGVVAYTRSFVDAYHERRRAHIEATKDEREQLWKSWNEMPIIKYFKKSAVPRNSNSSTFTIFDHLSNVIAYRRSEKSLREDDFNFWSADLRLRDAFDYVITPKWTPEKRENWDMLGRVAFKLYDTVFPGYLTRYQSQSERVFINGNCKIVDRTLELTLKLVDFCLNDNMSNLNKKDSLLYDYLQTTSPKRRGTFHNEENIQKYYLQRSVPHDSDSWIRPKFNGSYWDAQFLHTKKYSNVNRHAYKRAIDINSGPAGFNFYAWFVSVVESIIGYMFNVNSTTWWNDAKAWIKNPNTEESDWPDVGLRYWLLFFIRCHWPDNLNCSKGIGLKDALLWVSMGVLAAIIVGALILPPVAWIFSFVPAIITWAVLIGIIGFHYSPACVFMFPSLTGLGIALPMCLADELKSLFDTIFRACYSPIPIPPSMISGDVCPVDPNAYIDFVNCAIVGVSDGIQNILFFGTVVFGSWFYDITLMLAQSTLGLIIPGLNDYMRTTLDGFRDANPTQRERQWICFGLTAPSMIIVLLGFTLFFVALGFIIPLLIILLMKIWYLITASPLGSVLPGGDDDAWDEQFDEPDEKRGTQQDEEEDTQTLEDVKEWLRDRKDK